MPASPSAAGSLQCSVESVEYDVLFHCDYRILLISGYIEVVYKSYVSMRTCVTERTNAAGMYNRRSTQVC